MREKPFVKHNKMLKLLRERNVIISNGSNAKRILERENYYCIINGYKTLFLENNISMEIKSEKFRKGVTFEEIADLFEFDRELKQLMLFEIIKFESFAKTVISHEFHRIFPEKNSFLAFENYTVEESRTRDVLNVISTLSNQISKQRNNAVTYYIENYQHCPLWVLVNFLTFGNISKLYNVCAHTVRLNVSKEFSKHYKHEYKKQIQISPEMLDSCLGCMVMYRNVCAHDERLYNYKAVIKNKRALEKVLEFNKLDESNLFSIIVLLKLYLKKTDYKKLLKNYKRIFDKYESRFHSISIQQIKEITGYDDNWINEYM